MANNSSELTNRNITKMDGIELALSPSKTNKWLNWKIPPNVSGGHLEHLLYGSEYLMWWVQPMRVQQKGNLRRRRRRHQTSKINASNHGTVFGFLLSFGQIQCNGLGFGVFWRVSALYGKQLDLQVSTCLGFFMSSPFLKWYQYMFDCNVFFSGK